MSQGIKYYFYLIKILWWVRKGPVTQVKISLKSVVYIFITKSEQEENQVSQEMELDRRYYWHHWSFVQIALQNYTPTPCSCNCWLLIIHITTFFKLFTLNPVRIASPRLWPLWPRKKAVDIYWPSCLLKFNSRLEFVCPYLSPSLYPLLFIISCLLKAFINKLHASKFLSQALLIGSAT